MVESQHLVCERTSALNTEQSSSPFVCPLNLVCWGITFKSQASGVHALTQNLFIPLRAAQTPDYVQLKTHLRRDLGKGTAGPGQKSI